MAARLWPLVAVLLAAGCVGRPARDAPARVPAPPTTLSLQSELPPGAALSVAWATLRRSGWPLGAATATTLTTGWNETAAGPVRLFVMASEVGGGASTALSVWGETRGDDGGPVAIDRPDPVGPAGPWEVVEKAARRVQAEVRYARP
ncbi:MAG TPA: hypothetical protein VF576_04305 [Rubricoccaceae bacterium]|jgi:hypothetical protein